MRIDEAKQLIKAHERKDRLRKQLKEARNLLRNTIPYWILVNYVKFYTKFGGKQFTYEQAGKVINTPTALHMILHELKKYKLLSVRLNKRDTRRRIYKLK